MNTAEYIINDVRPFSLETSVREVQNAFNNLTYSHLPVFNEGTYLGCISETDAHCFESDKSILDIQYTLEGFFVRENTNWLDVLEAFAQHSSNIMPVLNEEQEYLGYVELGDIMNLFSETPFLHEAGGIIIGFSPLLELVLPELPLFWVGVTLLFPPEPSVFFLSSIFFP